MSLEERIKALEDMHVTGDEHGHPDRSEAAIAAKEAQDGDSA
jgi:hypothetical protein